MYQKRNHFWGPMLFIFLFFTFVPATFSSIQINEIMYDPIDCPDSKCEWIELFNPSNNTYSLENCSIDSKQIGNFSILNQSYLLVARNKQSFETNFITNNYATIIELPISLSNTGKELILSGTAWCNHSFDYSPYIDLVTDNNYSLEKYNSSLWNQSLFLTGSPGAINSIILDTTNLSNQTNTPIEDTAPNQSNVTNSSAFLPTYCDFELNLALNESISTSTNFTFSVTILNKRANQSQQETTANVSVYGKITDYFGQVVKEYTPWTNISTSSAKIQTYSPNLIDGIFLLDFEIYSVDCNDSNINDNTASTLFAISSALETQKAKSQESLNLSQVYPALCANNLKLVDEDSPSQTTAPDSTAVPKNQTDSENNNNNNNDVNDDNSAINNRSQDNNLNPNAQYQFTILPDTAIIGEELTLSLAVQSLDERPHNYSLHAYLYKGPICYSCANKTQERNHTIVSFQSTPNEVNYPEFTLQIDSHIVPADYKIKVNILKDNRKTYDEISSTISLSNPIESLTSIEHSLSDNNASNNLSSATNNLSALALQISNESEIYPSNKSNFTNSPVDFATPTNGSKQLTSLITGAITNPLIYQSTSAKAQVLVPALIIISSLILLFVLWKRKF